MRRGRVWRNAFVCSSESGRRMRRSRRESVATRWRRVEGGGASSAGKEGVGRAAQALFRRPGLLRKGKLGEWRRRRDGNALFAGETGKEFGNEVARWDGNSLELKLPGGVDRVVVDGVHFSAKVEEDLPKCALERIRVSGRVKMLPKGRVQLCVTYEEREPAVASDTVKGALGVDLNADHVAVARVSGEGRLLGVWRWDLEKHSDSVQQAARWVAGLAAELGVAVVAEDLDFRK